MSEDTDDLDLNAAWMRKAQGDMNAFMEAFATRMEGAMPGRISVERKRDGLLSKHSHVVSVAIDTDHFKYVLLLDKMSVQARRVKIVRGVTLKSETMAVVHWLQELSQEIARLSSAAQSSSSVLHDFLMS